MPNNAIANLFGRSPIQPIEKHIAVVHQAVASLTPLLEASNAADFNELEQVYNKISDIEHDADKIKTEIRLHLPKSLFMPVPRADLLDLLTTQDILANISKDIAGIMLGREMVIPKDLQKNLLKFAEYAIATSAKAVELVAELDNLLETGFASRQLKVLDKMMKELSKLEHKADQVEITVRKNLFKIEKDLPPVDVMFLYEIIRWIGEIADTAQRVGHRLQLLTAR